MSRVCVRVRREGEGERTKVFQINGPKADVRIATEKISNWNVGHVRNRHLDLLDIAAAVYAADSLVTRGGAGRQGFGAGWRRDLAFEIGVRDPVFWNATSVRQALAAVVQVLTDDRVSFSFEQSTDPAPPSDYLPIGKSEDASNREGTSDDVHVVLFSGGLDSLAGALEILELQSGRVILVTHRSAPKIIARQDALVERLQWQYNSRVAYVPVTATLRGMTAAEWTQRSRSFLFAALGYVVARTAGADRLRFYENGIVSQNLPISPQVIGTMATRTTHPATLAVMEQLFTLIDDRAFVVRNEFEWLTKDEVVRKLQACAAAKWITETASCNEVIRRDSKRSHCGACSQCLSRRFGVLASGLNEHEPDELYETGVLTGDREKLRSRTMALHWTLHALRLAEMDLDEFREQYSGEVARIARGLPELQRSEVLRRSFELHRRHGRSVKTVIEQAIAAQAGALLKGDLPETSLLRMVVATQTGTPALAEVAVSDAVPSDAFLMEDHDGDDDHEGRWVVSMRGEGSRRQLTVLGLGSVRGAPAGPAFALRPQFEADQAEGLAPDDHGYVSAGRLTPEGGASKNAVGQNVTRCRAKLSEFYTKIYGAPPPAPLLIQNRPNRGYRLDPHIVLIDADGGSEQA
jgi:7-cyano-7-deazaguanine synthase in queuosine biosynthesis